MCKLFVEFLLIRFFSVLNPAFSVREELTDVSALSFKKKKKKRFWLCLVKKKCKWISCSSTCMLIQYKIVATFLGFTAEVQMSA